jgi:hypothetical protein
VREEWFNRDGGAPRERALTLLSTSASALAQSLPTTSPPSADGLESAAVTTLQGWRLRLTASLLCVRPHRHPHEHSHRTALLLPGSRSTVGRWLQAFTPSWKQSRTDAAAGSSARTSPEPTAARPPPGTCGGFRPAQGCLSPLAESRSRLTFAFQLIPRRGNVPYSPTRRSRASLTVPFGQDPVAAASEPEPGQAERRYLLEAGAF